MDAYDAGTDKLLAKMGYSPEDVKRLRSVGVPEESPPSRSRQPLEEIMKTIG